MRRFMLLDYARVHCPALAIYAEHSLDVHTADARRRGDAIAWEHEYWAPLQVKSPGKIDG
jgi:hypothetical protein